MQTSIILAKIIGLYLTIFSVMLLARGQHVREYLKDFENHQPLIFFGTVVSLIIGILIVVFHNVWVMAWPVVITIIGWLILIRSLVYMFFPAVLPKMIKWFNNPKPLYITSVITLVLGLFLVYQGFVG